MRNQILDHPFQDQHDGSIYKAFLNVYYGTIRIFDQRCYNQAELNRLYMDLIESDGQEDWSPLHQATFTGRLNWTPHVLYTDLVKPYSLRLATERERAYRLTCQIGHCVFAHPNHFAAEGAARFAQSRTTVDSLTDWDLIDEQPISTDRPSFRIDQDDAITVRIEMVAPSAIYRHPEIFTDRKQAQATLDQLLDRYGRIHPEHGRLTISDPSRLIQALDGDSEPWEFDPQARKKSRPFSFFNLCLGNGIWVNSFAMWNRDRFRGTHMLREGAEIRVTATPSLYREKIQWRVRDFQLVQPAMHTTEAA